jgi:hypothetical protein
VPAEFGQKLLLENMDLVMRFKLEHVSTGKAPYVLARQMEGGDFTVGPGSRLGGARLMMRLSQPRSLNPDGSPDFTVFAFQLLGASDALVLKVGETVDLTCG